MTATIDHAVRPPTGPTPPRLALLTALHPRQHTGLLLATGAVALVAGGAATALWGLELWQAVAGVLLIMAAPAALTWRATAHRYGWPVAVGAAVVSVQGLHTIEHGVQWVQRHILHLSLRDANGLLSPANAEWVHFVWNWALLAAIVLLVVGGMRNVWAWALLIWATAHTLEHTYLLWRFLEANAELRQLGQGQIMAQGLPGIIGRGGWLDLNAGSQLPVFCGLPFVTTTDRLEGHFVWNAGEFGLLIPAVNAFVRRRLSP